MSAREILEALHLEPRKYRVTVITDPSLRARSEVVDARSFRQAFEKATERQASEFKVTYSEGNAIPTRSLARAKSARFSSPHLWAQVEIVEGLQGGAVESDAQRLIESLTPPTGVLAEPNTPGSRQFGRERSVRGDANLYRGEFNTLRAVQRGTDGSIVAGAVAGKHPKTGEWQLLLMETRPEYRRQGIMKSLLAKLTLAAGTLHHASEYTDDGKAFVAAAPYFFAESEGDVAG